MTPGGLVGNPGYDKTMHLALQLLGRRAYSVDGLRERLAKRCEDAAVVEQVVARVREMGYLSDERFATDYARARLRERPMGRRLLARELERHKVPSAVANQALEEACAADDERALIQRAIAKWTRVRGAPQTPRERQRLFEHLGRRGFDFGAIRDAVSELGSGVDPEEDGGEVR